MSLEYWLWSLRHWRKKKNIVEMERDMVKRRHETRLNNIQKKFDFYCPHCLFQTNSFSKICPNCKQGRLLQTTK